jgi:pimeloyl-ACP methyl ester carboxylesterase
VRAAVVTAAVVFAVLAGCFVAVEGASHDVHIDAPDQLVAAIEAFELETGSGSARSR